MPDPYQGKAVSNDDSDVPRIPCSQSRLKQTATIAVRTAVAASPVSLTGHEDLVPASRATEPEGEARRSGRGAGPRPLPAFTPTSELHQPM